MACWNVDNMFGGNNNSNMGMMNTKNQKNSTLQQNISPSFKFIMSKGSKNDSNNG